MELENIKPNLRWLFLIIGLIIILLLIYFIYLKLTFSTSDKTNLIANEVTENLNNETILEKDLIDTCKLKLSNCLDDKCNYNKALANNNENECFNIEDQSLLLDCTYELKKVSVLQTAVVSRNISLCIDSFYEDDRTSCKNNYYYSLSKLDNDKAYCNNISLEVLKNECLQN